eukprot:Em0010g854a
MVEVLKIILVGDSAVGKTCLVLRWAQEEFREHFLSTIGIDFKTRQLSVGTKQCKLQLWDTAGQERYRTIRKGFYRGAKGIVLVYDTTNEQSFVNVKKWMADISEYCGTNSQQGTPKLMLVGNKTDLEKARKVSSDRGSAEAAASGIRFAELSAKTGENVEQALVSFVEDIVRGTQVFEHTQRSLPGTGNIVQLELSNEVPKSTTNCTC